LAAFFLALFFAALRALLVLRSSMSHSQ